MESFMEDIKRDRIVIYAQILDAAKNGALKRDISNKVMIRYDRLNERLAELEKFSLLEKNDKIYKTKEKGLFYLEKYNKSVGIILPELKIAEVD